MKTLPAGGRLLVLAGGVGVARPAGPGTYQRQVRPAFSLWHAGPAHGPSRAHGQPPPASGRLPALFASTAPRRGCLRGALAALGSPWQPPKPSSLRLAEKLGIRLFLLPRQHPKLNPVDHLWRELKNDLAAKRQFAGVDELAAHAEGWVRALTSTQTLRKAGLLSSNCWLRKLRKTLWPFT